MLSRNHRTLYILLALLLQCWITVPLSLAGDAPAEAEGADVDEPPPEGYEERYYPFSDLCGELKDYSRLSDIPGTINKDSQTPPRLNAEQIIQILKVCAAPDSWGKHSPARISQSDSSLVVLQKPEVHEEVAKVMAWLHDGAMAPYHGTVVALKVKPELVAQLVQTPTALAPAELLKLIDEAGAESSPQVVDFNGFEGQCVIVSGTERRNYIHDFDVAGAVFDPVVRQLMAGLRLKTSGYRSPDCKAIRLDFEAELNRNLVMTSAHINTIVTGLQDTPPAPPPPPTDDKNEKKEKPPVIVLAQPPMRHVTQNRAQDLKLDLPSSSSATLCSALLLPQGKYGFVGTLDMGLTNNDGKTEVLAFFARATIGEESIPSLTGVSGLKQGEIFRLYPTQAMTRPLADYPGQNVSGISMDSETAVCAPFAARPAPENTGLRKAKSLFQEQVRKDKLVEPVGPVIFTRLTEADHQKLISALTTDYRRRYSPLRAHALAVAVPAEKGRKMILESARTFEYAAIMDLANGAGGQVLMNESISVFNQQRMSSFAGIKSHVIWDYDINGDSYDPAIRSILDRGYILDLQPNRCSDGKSLEVKINCQLVPSLGNHNRTILETNSVSAGATVNLVLTGNFDLDLPQTQVIDIHEQVKFAIGKYQLVGAAAVPGDGKSEARQTLLFVRMDNAGQ